MCQANLCKFVQSQRGSFSCLSLSTLRSRLLGRCAVGSLLREHFPYRYRFVVLTCSFVQETHFAMAIGARPLGPLDHTAYAETRSPENDMIPNVTDGGGGTSILSFSLTNANVWVRLRERATLLLQGGGWKPLHVLLVISLSVIWHLVLLGPT